MRGHIYKRIRIDKSGKQHAAWYVVIEAERGVDGTRHQKWHGGYKTRREAEAARARLVNEINVGLYVPPSGATFQEWAEDHWLPTIKGQLKVSTWDSYSRNMKLHVLPAIGGIKLKNLTPSHLNRLYRGLAEPTDTDHKPLSPKTIRYIHLILHKALSDAVESGLIANNPGQRACPPRTRTDSSGIKAWTIDQLRQFLEIAQNDHLYVAFHLAAMTGMRRGEILGLMWEDIDLSHARLSVRRSLISVAYQISISTPKSNKSRVVDLDSETIRLLETHQVAQGNEAATWGDGYERSGFAFTREDGSPIHPESLSHRFQTLERYCGELPRIHLLITSMASGIPVKVMSERLGHESPAFTLKQYAHVMPGMQAEAAALIADLVRKAKES